jgi:hypothetical protein
LRCQEPLTVAAFLLSRLSRWWIYCAIKESRINGFGSAASYAPTAIQSPWLIATNPFSRQSIRETLKIA